MIPVPLHHVLALASILFALGLVGVVVRRNLLFQLVSVEVMLNAAGLAFVAAGARWGAPDGQVVFLFVLAMAAAEVSVGLALVLQIRKRFGTLDADELDRLGHCGGHRGEHRAGHRARSGQDPEGSTA